MLESILRSERVYFADFTLIIFDECHHAVNFFLKKIQIFNYFYRQNYIHTKVGISCIF